MQNHAFERIEFSLPRLLLQHMLRVLETGLPTMPYAGPTKIDILVVVFMIEAWGEQLNDMHPGRASVRSEFFHRIGIAFIVSERCRKLADDVAHAMSLPLPGYMARNSTRVLNVLMPMKNLSHRLWLGASRIPHVHGKDQRVFAWIIIEHDLGRSVRQDATVPVQFSVDTDRRKCRRQGAGSKNVFYRNLRHTAIEVAHLAGPHMSGPDGEPQSVTIDPREVDKLRQRLLKRHGRIVQ